MENNLSEEREALHQMICALKSDDIQKVISYVSFLRFVDVCKDKTMTDLLKMELAKGDLPKPAPQDSPHDTVDSYVPPPLEFSYNTPVPDALTPEAVKPEFTEPVLEPVIEQFIEDAPRYKKLDDEFYESLKYEIAAPPEEPVAADDTPVFFEDSESFYAPVRSDYFNSNKKPGPSESFFFDESVPEPIQPEPTRSESIFEDSGHGEEPFLQTTPLSQEPSVQKLKRVVKSLRLNFADVAFLFRLSLPMARMWLAGSALGAEEEMQLQYLLEVAERVEEMDIPRLDRAIRRPMADGEFFMEKLKDRKVTDDNLKTLRETAERSEELRRKFKGATKPFYSMQNAIGLYSMPLY